MLQGRVDHLANFEQVKSAQSSPGQGKPYNPDFSDFLRLIVLWSFGGLYLDADVISLRDMWPLQTLEFAYRWSYLLELNNVRSF